MHDYRFDGTSWKADIKLYAYRDAHILFNNNDVQSSNIKCIGNRRHGFWHMVLTAHFSILLLLLDDRKKFQF